MYPSPRHEEIQNAVKTPKKTATSSSPLSKLGKIIYWPFDLIFNKAFHLEAVKALALPIALGVIASWTTQRLQWEANQNQILDDYFNQIEKLVLEANLMEETPKAGSIVLARGRTIAALSELDLKRKNQLFAFLSASNLTEGGTEDEGQTEAIIGFDGQNLSDIDLEEVNLRKVNFAGVEIRQGKLHRADLREANFSKANLIAADLSKTILGGTNLSKASLYRANLKKAILYDADLSEAWLTSTNFESADLELADLSKADLFGANLSKASLYQANLRKANLSKATLNNAFLIATDLRETAHLRPEQLTGDNQPYLCGAALPSNITGIDPNRDCDALFLVLLKEYDYSSEEAQKLIDQARNKQWD